MVMDKQEIENLIHEYISNNLTVDFSISQLNEFVLKIYLKDTCICNINEYLTP